MDNTTSANEERCWESQVLRDPAAAGESYNAADGTFRTHEFLGPLAQWLGAEYPESPDFETPDRTYMSCKVQALGYTPVVTFEHAMAEIEEHLRVATKLTGVGTRYASPYAAGESRLGSAATLINRPSTPASWATTERRKPASEEAGFPTLVEPRGFEPLTF